MASKKPTGDVETLLVELLTEELPPKALAALAQAFAGEIENGLARRQLKSASATQARVFATPRRLAALVAGVSGAAADRPQEISGPSVKAPQEAVAGFARKHGLEIGQLERRETPKGEVFVARTVAKGAALDAVLAEIVAEAAKKLPVPKVMRWGDGVAEFARPVHGLVMLHGERVVPGTVLGVESGNETLGHRFLSKGAIAVRHADDYEKLLGEKGRVIADFAARRAEISKQLQKAAGGAALVIHDALLDEITSIVEASAVYAGEFSSDFLAVPEECLILSMQQHQRYVPLRDAGTGKLLPRFLFVSNIETKEPREIIHGNERVLRARLSDAKFFYDQDRKARLEERVARLAHVVYHNKLGSQLERVERIKKLSGIIARDLKADAAAAERGAWLSKADLLTEMVGEFPELQGTVGRYYALHDGEPADVAAAIGEHYRPRFAGDGLPEGPVACAVAVADKLDTLAGLFGIGQVPTGDRDPFGLRRAALGVVRILVERDLPLSLKQLVETAYEGYSGKVGGAHTDLETFIFERYSGYLRDLGYSALQVESVLSKRPVQLSVVPKQLEAVKAFQALPEAESLVAANKRVANILKQAASKGESYGSAERSELKEPAEVSLFDALAKIADSANALFERGDYAGYLKTFAVLKTPVDDFFDKVMVMAEQETLRRNRLALLNDLSTAMNRFADISKLAA
jgi:glycyl-tRNA synthetase beta chain